MPLIENLIKQTEEHVDCDDFEEVQEECLFQIKKEELGISAVEPLLLFMERHPLSDFGMPGAIVHYAEQFYKKEYEDLLIASVTRKNLRKRIIVPIIFPRYFCCLPFFQFLVQ